MLNSISRHLPNIVSSIRILMAPILLYLAINGLPISFILLLIFTELTDVLDGYLARRMNLVSELGAQLDSWGDFFVYITMAISAWLLWPDIVMRELVYVIIMIACFTLPVIIGLIKFKTWTSYHTLSVKVAVAISVIAYVLLFTGLLDWPLKVAIIFSLYAALEQILITLICHKGRHVDVKSIWHALKEKKPEMPL
ncbi:CDP-alcohol phosphatidyltransferase family protein [sulfur-oxidizing endosymbiont of Gigantopelta aegis]|uniref:CDP-alcohol phosphatidyltransferase family protein n=1 Tax=sulfur-oxidizing endosymbiont of Gigantopelta aegis TaxID=2794934 RepID=UPI0018DB5529|nr:CDP-alcohol phosphatidyltransferase family protein [sulfur-oxidizing endosymbiont of Gigantopelta aegis]